MVTLYEQRHGLFGFDHLSYIMFGDIYMKKKRKKKSEKICGKTREVKQRMNDRERRQEERRVNKKEENNLRK